MTNNIDIEKLAKENGFIPSAYADGECYADLETLKQFAEAYAAEKQRQQEPVAKIKAQWSCPDSFGGKHRERYVQFKNGIIPKEGAELFTTPPDQAREIEELKNEVADLSRINEIRKRKLSEKQAHINILREALEDMNNGWKYIRQTHGDLYGVGWDRAQKKAKQALSTTPAQSLQSVINETIERCAKVCDELANDEESGHRLADGAGESAEAIRALKEGE